MATVAEPFSTVEELRKRYIVPQNPREIQRLTDQHEWVKGNMGGSLVKAPIDYQKCERILDSATADGYWLVDIMPLFPASTHFVGFDVAPELFIPAETRPPNLELVTQNLVEPFPDHWKESFDLVHQRFILPLFKEKELDQVLGRLIATLKPGGWIQFVEPDFSSPIASPEDKTGPFRMIHELTRVTMPNYAPGPQLQALLERAGMVNVTVEVNDMVIGHQHPDPKLGECSYRNYQEVIGYYHSCNVPETFGMSKEDWDQLPAKFAENMRMYKTAIKHYIVYAQKPL